MDDQDQTPRKKKYRGNPYGCPSRLSFDLIEKICSFVEDGCSIEDALSLSGVPHTTYYYWRKVGEGVVPNASAKQRSLAATLIEHVKRSQSVFKHRNLNNIKKFSDKNFIASCWLLERRFPQEFSLVNRIDANINQNVSIKDALSEAEAIVEQAPSPLPEEGAEDLAGGADEQP